MAEDRSRATLTRPLYLEASKEITSPSALLLLKGVGVGSHTSANDVGQGQKQLRLLRLVLRCSVMAERRDGMSHSGASSVARNKADGNPLIIVTLSLKEPILVN